MLKPRYLKATAYISLYPCLGSLAEVIFMSCIWQVIFQGSYSGELMRYGCPVEKSRSMNGVAMRDGELILWGMKAMA